MIRQLCKDCKKQYVDINPKNGKPFYRCQSCRIIHNERNTIRYHHNGEGREYVREYQRANKEKFNSYQRERYASFENKESGVPGIYWNKQHQTWDVHLSVKGGFVRIGYFANLNKAIEELDNAKNKYADEIRNK